jgi:hypothetical protein
MVVVAVASDSSEVSMSTSGVEGAGVVSTPVVVVVAVAVIAPTAVVSLTSSTSFV